MNRQLKFRAWVNNEMVYLPFAALQYYDFEGSYAMSFVVDGYDGFWAHEMYESVSKEKCSGAPIMQFTGLKDKNGKEIYERDICRLFSCNRPIVYKEGAFGYMTELNSKYAEFIPIRNHHFDWTDNQSNKIEVIGNIYENAELLNPEEVGTNP